MPNECEYNVLIAKKLGSIKAAIYLGHLLRDSKLNEIERNGKRYTKVESLEVNLSTALTHREQQFAIKRLVEKDIAETQVFGKPTKMHIHLKMKNLEKL